MDNDNDNDSKTLYTVDIHLAGGTVMRNVTVSKLVISTDAVEWNGAGPDPLIWLRRDAIEGIVRRGEETIL